MRRIPGEASRFLARKLRAVECPEVTFLSGEFPVFWRKAAGSRVWDVDGNRYIDMTGAFAVANLGHGHPAVRAAMIRQARRMVHGMGDVHPPEGKARLLEELNRILPRARGGWMSILGQNGSDAVEAAIKTVQIARPGRDGIVAFTGAYHGLSYGALSVTWRPDFRKPFAARISKKTLFAPYPYCYRCPLKLKYPDCGIACLDETRKKIRKAGGPRKFGAVIVEPIQGRGGEVVPPRGWLSRLADICRREGLLLIADEIYTGFGRTGRMFACDHEGVVPDLMCLGKGLTGGFPLSVCAGKSAVMRRWPRSAGEAVHTSTFLGHPVGCAMGVAALEIYRTGKPARQARVMGAYFLAALRRKLGDLGPVGDIRGKGLMIGVELVRNRKTKQPHPALAGGVMTRALREGLILLSGGIHQNVLSFSPPLSITRREIDFCVDILEDALQFEGERQKHVIV